MGNAPPASVGRPPHPRAPPTRHTHRSPPSLGLNQPIPLPICADRHAAARPGCAASRGRSRPDTPLRDQKTHMAFVGIIGNNSTDSTNRSLMQCIAAHFADRVQVEPSEIRPLPAFHAKDSQTPEVRFDRRGLRLGRRHHRHPGVRPLVLRPGTPRDRRGRGRRRRCGPRLRAYLAVVERTEQHLLDPRCGTGSRPTRPASAPTSLAAGSTATTTWSRCSPTTCSTPCTGSRTSASSSTTAP